MGNRSSSMKAHISSKSNRKSDNHVLALSSDPVKEQLLIVNGNGNGALNSTANSGDFGGKEEAFFDSQAWLESDCESDFMSVNGEFTPSRGNTPVHHNFPATTLSGGDTPSTTISQSSPSPVNKKKRLSDLFSESQRENCNYDEENNRPSNKNVVVGSLETATVPGRGLKSKRERLVEIVQVHGCFPKVHSSCRPVTPHQTKGSRK